VHMTRPMLTIDSREPAKVRADVKAKVQALMDVDVQVETLPVGDYCWDNEIIIERKTVCDYISSVKDGRIFTQCADMDQYSKSYVFIVGKFDKARYCKPAPQLTSNQRIGSMCSLLAKTTTKILPVDSPAQFAVALVKIREKHHSLDKTFLVERHSKTINRIDPNFGMYLSLDGVGMSTAKKIQAVYPKFIDFIQDYKCDCLDVKVSKKTTKFLDSIL